MLLFQVPYANAIHSNASTQCLYSNASIQMPLFKCLYSMPLFKCPESLHSPLPLHSPLGPRVGSGISLVLFRLPQTGVRTRDAWDLPWGGSSPVKRLMDLTDGFDWWIWLIQYGGHGVSMYRWNPSNSTQRVLGGGSTDPTRLVHPPRWSEYSILTMLELSWKS
jgi:hypothetical protein